MLSAACCVVSPSKTYLTRGYMTSRTVQRSGGFLFAAARSAISLSVIIPTSRSFSTTGSAPQLICAIKVATFFIRIVRGYDQYIPAHNFVNLGVTPLLQRRFMGFALGMRNLLIPSSSPPHTLDASQTEAAVLSGNLLSSGVPTGF
jgi:hypothetical protein